MAGCNGAWLQAAKSLLMKSIIRTSGSWHGDCSYECKQAKKEEADKMIERTKILVVDDEEVVRLSLLRTLSGEHCNVAVVWNGKEALQMMEQQKFDVVLLDLRMPGMSGMAVLKTIKERWPESEVIIITGYPAVDSAKEAVTLGAYDYLAKPVGPDDVINAANGALLHKRWALRSDQPVVRAGMQ
jgi:DNA-binding NtrC family response regulator